jgi:hypothetical protein
MLSKNIYNILYLVAHTTKNEPRLLAKRKERANVLIKRQLAQIVWEIGLLQVSN